MTTQAIGSTLMVTFHQKLQNVVLITIVMLILTPLTLFCQTPEEITKSTKEFLKNISFLEDTLRGVIVIVPRESQITGIMYERNNEIIRRDINDLAPHPQFFVLEDFDLNTLLFTYSNSSNRRVIDFFSTQQIRNFRNLVDFQDQLVLLNLPIGSVKIDTFQINPRPPKIDTIYVHDTTYVSVSDTIICREKKDFGKILGYSLLPGGSRFYTKHPWQGIFLGILQVAPIPLAIHFNNQRQKFLDLAEEAAARGDLAALDENFDKSQNFRLRSQVAIGFSVAATLINIVDVLIKVKDIQCEPLISPNGVRFSISKKL